MINFMKYRYLYFVFSLCFLLPGFISLALFGVRPSIDFTGGSLLEVSVVKNQKNVALNKDSLQKVLGDSYEIVSLQPTGTSQFILRGKPTTNDQKIVVLARLSDGIGQVKEQRFETVGPVLGKELLTKTLVAGALVAAIIIIYIWSQFHSLKYGVAAVLAMCHDAFIVIGAFSVLGKFFGIEVDVLFVTALLTILSFSVHDTIIVFDRIRETVKKHPSVPFVEVVNSAVLQTLGRSINNSMTIIIMLSTLVLLGGETIRWFASALLIGAITGTYSSTFTAAPLLVVWDEMAAKLKKMKAKKPPKKR
jgi:preprotein translocase subunit SecF